MDATTNRRRKDRGTVPAGSNVHIVDLPQRTYGRVLKGEQHVLWVARSRGVARGDLLHVDETREGTPPYTGRALAARVISIVDRSVAGPGPGVRDHVLLSFQVVEVISR